MLSLNRNDNSCFKTVIMKFQLHIPFIFLYSILNIGYSYSRVAWLIGVQDSILKIRSVSYTVFQSNN